MKPIRENIRLFLFFWALCLGGYLLILWLYKASITRYDIGNGILSAIAIAVVITWTIRKRREEESNAKTKKDHDLPRRKNHLHKR